MTLGVATADSLSVREAPPTELIWYPRSLTLDLLYGMWRQVREFATHDGRRFFVNVGEQLVLIIWAPLTMEGKGG